MPATLATAMRTRAIPLLRALAAASLLLPLAVLALGSWHLYRDETERARRELDRATAILENGLLRVLGANRLAMRSVQDLLADLSDAEIRARERALHERLVAITRDLPEVASIWINDAEGAPVVSSLVYPIPPGHSSADRGFFQAHLAGAPLHIGELIIGRVVPTLTFTISLRRTAADGSFRGVVQNALDPEQFARLAATVDREHALSMVLVRDDGAVLATYPAAARPGQRLEPHSSPMMRMMLESPAAGTGIGVSPIHGETRLFAYRRLGDYPVYLGAALQQSAVTAAWLSATGRHLIVGLPAALSVFALTLLALGRTRRLAAEADRRQLAESALRQAQKLEALGQLTGGVAHDFNNILTVVRGSVELLDERDGRDHKRAVRAVLEATAKGSALTRHLLTFSRSQMMHPEVIDLHDALGRLAPLIRLTVRGDVALSIVAPPQVSRIRVDPGELELALLNAAVNARDAMPTGGSLTLSARDVTLDALSPTGLVGQFVEIAVQDTGIGIPPELLDRVFEPFFTTKEPGAGTGLGLSQIYGFARQSGGGASIESRPGHGTRLLLHLPVTDALPALPEAAEHGAARPLAGHVLLVDDNEEVAGVLEELLRHLGLSVTRVASAAAALDRVESAAERVDLVLSDIVMPGALKGLDLAHRLRARHPALPILLMTGYSVAAAQATREGFALIRKPFGRDSLADAIQRALADGGAAAPEPASVGLA